MGICGEPTDLTDSFGTSLFVGDLVDVYIERPDKRGAAQEVAGPEYVVHWDSDEEPFIMGLKSSMYPVKHYYLDGNESDKSDYDYCETHYINDKFLERAPEYLWLIRKIKGYKDTVHGERWGSGNVTTYLMDEDKERKEEKIEEVF